jgi:hypothetical protein
MNYKSGNVVRLVGDKLEMTDVSVSVTDEDVWQGVQTDLLVFSLQGEGSQISGYLYIQSQIGIPCKEQKPEMFNKTTG